VLTAPTVQAAIGLPTQGPSPAPTIDLKANMDLAMARIEMPRGDIIATVNGQPVTAARYIQYMRLRLYTLDQQYAVDWSKEENMSNVGQVAKGVADQLVDMELLRQQAALEGVTIPDQDLANLRSEVQMQILSTGEDTSWEGFTQRLSISDETFTQVLHESLLIDKLMELHGGDIEQEQVRASHILVATEELAAELLTRLKAGEDFGALAEEYSQDPGSAQQGGDLGWFPRGVMVPEFEQVAFGLEPGALSEVVPSQFGFHIILLTEKGLRPLAPEMAEQTRWMAFEEWFKGLQSQAQIERLIYTDTE
jgi:foldase protein PrsA